MFLRDVGHAFRAIRRKPQHASAVVLTMALGIGATTAVFSIVNGVLLRPLPYHDAQNIAMVFRTVPRFGFTRSTASFPDFSDWRDRTRSFSALAAYASGNATYQGPDGAERWTGYRVTAGLFPLLGVTPELGRTFSPTEDAPGAPPTVVLSHATWQSRFGADPGILGKTIPLSGNASTIIGVMPADFAFPARQAAFWTALRGDPTRMERDANFLSVLGRLAPRADIDAAQREMTALAGEIDRTAPGANEGYGIYIEPRLAFVVRNAKTALLVFQGAVLLVLALACANVTNLMLARAASRTREWAVRASLGATRAHLARQLLTESLVLTGAGGLAGLGLSAALLKLVQTLGSTQLPRLDEVALDGDVLAATMLLTVLCGLICGTAPAIVGARNPSPSLKEGTRAAGIGRAGRAWQEALAVSQLVLAIVLTVGAGLLINSFARLTAVEPGFDPVNVVAGRVASGRPVEERRRLFETLERQVASLPGVTSAALAYSLPFSPHGFSGVVTPEGQDAIADAPSISGSVVTGPYFATMRIPLLRGRTFDDRDRTDAPGVGVVNATFAARFWPGQDPLGRRIRLGDDADDPWTTVIGVVADSRQQTLGEEPAPFYYMPLTQAGFADGMYVIARATGSPVDLVPLIRTELRSIDASLPLTDVAVAADLIDQTVSAPRFRTLLLGIFGSLALLLALVGVYAVMAYGVGERTREIGVRIALGARQSNVMGLVLQRSARLTALGLALGLTAAWFVTRFLTGMLYGITPTDTTTFVAAAALLVLVSASASLIPARRAARINPVESLRET